MKIHLLEQKTKNLFYLIVLSFLSLPIQSSAQNGGIGGTGSGNLENPITANSIQALIEIIIKIFIAIGTPIAILFLVYSGFKFVTAQGKPDDIKDAKVTFVWTLVGIAILLGATVLAAIIEGTITQLGAGI